MKPCSRIFFINLTTFVSCSDLASMETQFPSIKPAKSKGKLPSTNSSVSSSDCKALDDNLFNQLMVSSVSVVVEVEDILEGRREWEAEEARAKVFFGIFLFRVIFAAQHGFLAGCWAQPFFQFHLFM